MAQPTTDVTSLVPLEDYSRALDEIFHLRQLMAYEAEVLAVHLEYKTFPKSRRGVAEREIERMRECARGEHVHAWYGVSYLSLRNVLKRAGARSDTLTRGEWEAQG